MIYSLPLDTYDIDFIYLFIPFIYSLPLDTYDIDS